MVSAGRLGRGGETRDEGVWVTDPGGEGVTMVSGLTAAEYHQNIQAQAPDNFTLHSQDLITQSILQ